jgi:hypothetical protein
MRAEEGKKKLKGSKKCRKRPFLVRRRGRHINLGEGDSGLFFCLGRLIFGRAAPARTC